jgi:hypothetical protein
VTDGQHAGLHQTSSDGITLECGDFLIIDDKRTNEIGEVGHSFT